MPPAAVVTVRHQDPKCYSQTHIPLTAIQRLLSTLLDIHVDNFFLKRNVYGVTFENKDPNSLKSLPTRGVTCPEHGDTCRAPGPRRFCCAGRDKHNSTNGSARIWSRPSTSASDVPRQRGFSSRLVSRGDLADCKAPRHPHSAARTRDRHQRHSAEANPEGTVMKIGRKLLRHRFTPNTNRATLPAT